MMSIEAGWAGPPANVFARCEGSGRLVMHLGMAFQVGLDRELAMAVWPIANIGFLASI
jgi:hypothetical protein